MRQNGSVMRWMKKPILLFIAVLLLAGKTTQAQSYSSQRSQVLLINTLSNALMGGFGGLINRQHHEKWYTAFARNFLKGGAGGLIKYTAKYQSFYLHDPSNSVYAPLNRLVYFLGHSMVMNAAYDRRAFERFYCNFYGVDLRFDSKAEHKLQARVSLASLAGLAEYAAMGYQFNIYRTLQYGIFMFDARGLQLLPYDGQTRFNTVVTRSNVASEVLPHEWIHTFQLYDLFPLTALYDKKLRPHYENRRWYKTLSRYMVLDYEALYMPLLYAPQFRRPPHYYKNYFEFEAQHFATRNFIAK